MGDWTRKIYNFYPRSPRGEQPCCQDRVKPCCLFLSTLPARGATGFSKAFGQIVQTFLSTLPARGATRQVGKTYGINKISIHAPREGSDAAETHLSALDEISIHAPREGSDAFRWGIFAKAVVFLSTLPARGATNDILVSIHHFGFLSTLPARGATCSRVSILPPSPYFYPRSPRGERPITSVSIIPQNNFYPRSPRGERLYKLDETVATPVFLSTLPARGATSPDFDMVEADNISIHAPREGSDTRGRLNGFILTYFYPRSPRGERRTVQRIPRG